MKRLILSVVLALGFPALAQQIPHVYPRSGTHTSNEKIEKDFHLHWHYHDDLKVPHSRPYWYGYHVNPWAHPRYMYDRPKPRMCVYYDGWRREYVYYDC